MIKVDTTNSAYNALEVHGQREIVCLELMLATAMLLKNDVIKDADKKALKNVLDLEPKLLDNLLQELIDTLNEL